MILYSLLYFLHQNHAQNPNWLLLAMAYMCHTEENNGKLIKMCFRLYNIALFFISLYFFVAELRHASICSANNHADPACRSSFAARRNSMAYLATRVPYFVFNSAIFCLVRTETTSDGDADISIIIMACYSVLQHDVARLLLLNSLKVYLWVF